jgi:hypothetical protein
MSPAVEIVYVDRGPGLPRRMLRVLGRRREGRFTVLELAPQRRRCQRGSCLRLVDVPTAFCFEHEPGTREEEETA